MKIRPYIRIAGFFALAFPAVILACTYSALQDPDTGIQASDLAGTWEADYGSGVTDRIQIHEDGTFKQTYNDPNTGYTFETDWDHWELDTFADGRVWIYLEGGRYYASGKRIGELDGHGDPCPPEFPDCIHGNNPRPFYDPYDANFTVEMVNRLVLTVRVNSEGEIFFHHLWTTPDGSFSLIGGDTEVFHRVDEGADE